MFWLLLGSLPDCVWLLGCLVTLLCIVVAYLILVWSFDFNSVGCSDSLLVALIVVHVDCVWLGVVVYRIVYFRLLFDWLDCCLVLLCCFCLGCLLCWVV